MQAFTTAYDGTDLDAAPQPGIGAAIWLHATDVQAIHDALAADGHMIVAEPIDGPFGRTFTFADPDGYVWEVAHNPGWTLADDGSVQL